MLVRPDQTKQLAISANEWSIHIEDIVSVTSPPGKVFLEIFNQHIIGYNHDISPICNGKFTPRLYAGLLLTPSLFVHKEAATFKFDANITPKLWDSLELKVQNRVHVNYPDGCFVNFTWEQNKARHLSGGFFWWLDCSGQFATSASAFVPTIFIWCVGCDP